MRKILLAVLSVALLLSFSASPAQSLFKSPNGQPSSSSTGEAIDLQDVLLQKQITAASTPGDGVIVAGLPIERPYPLPDVKPAGTTITEAVNATVTLNLWVSFQNNQNNWKPARFIKVEVWDKDELTPDDLLASNFTDPQGYITFTVDSMDPELRSGYQDIYFKIWCTNDRVDVSNGISTYVSISPTQWNLSPGSYQYSYGVAQNQNGAFNINDAITKASQFVSRYDSQIAKVYDVPQKLDR